MSNRSLVLTFTFALIGSILLYGVVYFLLKLGGVQLLPSQSFIMGLVIGAIAAHISLAIFRD